MDKEMRLKYQFCDTLRRRDMAMPRESIHDDKIPFHLDLPSKVKNWEPIDIVIVSGLGDVESDTINASVSEISIGPRSANNFDVFRLSAPTFIAREKVALAFEEVFPECFQVLDVRCDAFPVKMVYPHLTRPDVIDWDQTVVERMFSSSERVMKFSKLVAKELSDHPDVFSIDEYPAHLLVSPRFVEFVEERGIRGFEFRETDT